MNAALDLDAGVGTTKGFVAGALVPLSGGRSSASMNASSVPGGGQEAVGPEDARRGFETHPSSGSASFQSNWQSMLRAWGVNGTPGEAGSTGESEAAELESAGATSARATSQNLASSSRIAGSFTGSGTPGTQHSLSAIDVSRRQPPQPRSGATTRDARPQPSIQTSAYEVRKPLSAQSRETSAEAISAHNASTKRRETITQKPAEPSASAVSAGPGEMSVPAAVALPGAVVMQAQAAPAGAPNAPELPPGLGSFDRAAQEQGNGNPTIGLPAIAEMAPASPSSAPRLPSSPAKAAEGQQADRRLVDPRENRFSTTPTESHSEMAPASRSNAPRLPGSLGKTAEGQPGDSGLVDRGATRSSTTQTESPDESARLNSPAASSEPVEGRESIPAAAIRGPASQQSENGQNPFHAPVAVGMASVTGSNADAPVPGTAAVGQAGWNHSGFDALPPAQNATVSSLDGRALSAGEARRAAVPQARAGEANSVLRKTQAGTTSAGAGVSGWVNVPESAQAASPRVAAAAASIGTSQAAAKETFAALDMETGVTAPRWIHAGGHQAEAGFEDPALGWVGVRADLSGGSIHASLVPATAEAGEALSAHMAGLSAYLTEQNAPVAVLTLADSSTGSSAAGAGQHMQQGAGQNAEAGGSTHAETSQRSGNRVAAGASSEPVQMPAGVFDAARGPGDARGMHISVMA
jgi:hypothetical protein